MTIVEKVTIEDSKDYSTLCNLIYSAVRGEYVSQLETSQGTEELDKLIVKELDEFATKYFKLGRKYEQDKQ